MGSVAEIIRERKREEKLARAVASQEELIRRRKLFGARVRRWITENHGSISQFLHTVYQNTKSAGRLYPILNGEGGLTDKQLALWATRLGKDFDSLRQEIDAMRPELLEDKPLVPAQAQANPPWSRGDIGQTAPPPPPSRPLSRDKGEQFALVVGADGRAELRLHLHNVPMSLAMRAMAALTSAGILATGQEDKETAGAAHGAV